MTPTHTNRNAIYLRKSRADLALEAVGEKETLARHKKILLDFAKRSGIQVLKIYEEIVSGETIAARPVMQQLLAEVEAGEWDGVLVMEVERLARGDSIDQGVIARAFKLNGTKIITPVKTYDPENEYDEEYFEFGLFMSRREYKTINRRIQRGRVQSAKDGKFIGGTAPYGYEKVRLQKDHGYKLEIKPEEADIVKLIYEMYTAGTGMTQIAAKLENMGVKTHTGKSVWNKSSVNDILKNPVYIGKIRWGYKKEKKVPDGTGFRIEIEKNPDCIYVDGLHEAIVSEEMFDRAARMRQSRTFQRTKKELTLKNPLSGVVYCGKCGQLMTRLGANTKMHYDAIYCPNRKCNTVSAPVFLVEEKILENFKSWLDGYKVKLKKEVSENSKAVTSDTAIETLKKELKNTEEQILNTYDLVERGIYSDEVFVQRNTSLSEKKEEIIKKIISLEEKNESTYSARELLEKYIPQAENFVAGYSDIKDIEERNAVLKMLVTRVEYIKTTANTRGHLNRANFDLILYPRIEIK